MDTQIDKKRVIYIGEKVERLEVQDAEESHIKTVLIYNTGDFLEFNTQSKELYRIYITQEDLDLAKSINKDLPEEEKVQAKPTKKVLFDVYYWDISKPKSILPILEKYIELQA